MHPLAISILLLLVLLGLAQLSRYRQHRPRAVAFAGLPGLERLEERDTPSGTLQVDVVSVGGADLSAAVAKENQSPYAHVAWTGSVGSVNDIQKGLANGSIPWQGSDTVVCAVGGPDSLGQHTTWRSVLNGPGGGAVVETFDPAGVSPEGLLWEDQSIAYGNITEDRGTTLANMPHGPDSIESVDKKFANNFLNTSGLTQEQELFLLFFLYEYSQGAF